MSKIQISQIEHLLDRRGTKGSSGDDLLPCLMHALEGDTRTEQRLMSALIPLLIILFTRRLRVDRDILENLVHPTIQRVPDERDSSDEHEIFSKWLFGLARLAILELLDRQADNASPGCEARTLDAEYRVLMSRTHTVRSQPFACPSMACRAQNTRPQA